MTILKRGGYSFLGIMPKPFNKPPLTYAEQVELLKSRGMEIEDNEEAIFYLSHINYYRLTAYWLPFESDHSTHQFKSNTNFKTVLKLYIFDRELRLLLLDAIERIEVSIRTQWAYHMAHHYGTHSHLNSDLAKDFKNWEENLSYLRKEVERSNERFIKHSIETYLEDLPAIWVVCEIMSFGLLSKWYDNLKPMPTRQAISSTFKINEQVLSSWLRHLTIIRNICAHHSRLWNREFTVTPTPTRTKKLSISQAFIKNSEAGRKIYNSFLIILHFMDIISPNHSWRQRLKNLLYENSEFLTDMGFPDRWDEQQIWLPRI